MVKKQTLCKNPLAQAFGMALRRQRDVMGKTSKDIAATLDIGPSFYRLVESGTNNLHVSKAIPLIDAFEGRLDFDGVSKILMTISYMEALGKRAIGDSHYAEGLKGAVEKLLSYDEDKLRPLLELFMEVNLFDRIKQVSANEIGEEIASNGLDVIVNDFITKYDAFGKSDEQVQNEYLLRTLNEVPSIYFDFVTNTVQNLTRLPRYVYCEDYWEWERQNKETFKDMICLTNKSESVVSAENLERYKYEHLWESRFREEKCIVLAEMSSIQLKQDFDQLLKESLKKDNNIGKLKSFDTSVKKMKFKTLGNNTDAIKLAKSLLKGDHYAKPKEHENYDAIWVFTTEDNKNIGFMAKIDYKSVKHKNQLVHVVSLTYDEVMKRMKLLKELWNRKVNEI